MASRKRGAKRGTIEEAFKKRAVEAPQVAYLESDGEPSIIADAFIQDALQQYEHYKDQQRVKAVVNPDAPELIKTRSRVAQELADDEYEDELEDDKEDSIEGQAAAKLSRKARWERRAEICLYSVGRWAGGPQALPQPVQEMLVNICMNHHMHANPELSVQAARLLQADLAAHPPVKLVNEAGLGPHLVVYTGSRWHPLNQSKLLDDLLGHGFTSLFTLITNAATMAEAAATTSGAGSPGETAAGKPGQALLLCHLVQLLKLDALPRLQLVQDHLQLLEQAGRGRSAAEKKVIRERLAPVLRNSLLVRLLQEYGSWADHAKGKTQFVRHCLSLIALGPAPGAAELGASQEQGPSSNSPSSSSPSSPAAAAMPVLYASLTSSARQLLVLALELLSGCEEVGVYSQAPGRNERDNIRENDRLKLDMTMVDAIQGLNVLQECKHLDGVRRVLQALPPRHVVRLMAMMVADAIEKRPYEEQGNKKSAHVQAWSDYLSAGGKGYEGFKQGDALDIVSGVVDRYDWASKIIMSGKQFFATSMCCFICAAVTGGQLQRDNQAKEFTAAAKGLLQKMTQKVGSNPQVIGKGEDPSVVMDVALAMQMVASLA